MSNNLQLIYSDLHIKLYNGDSADLSDLVSDFAQLIFTSPPYNIGKAYPQYNDLQDWDTYWEKQEAVWRQCFLALREGGILAVNMPFTLRRTRNKQLEIEPGYSQVIDLCNYLGFHYRDTLVWAKRQYNDQQYQGGHVGPEPNPYLAPVCEPVILFSKGSFTMQRNEKVMGHRQHPIARNLLYLNDAAFEAQFYNFVSPFPVELANVIITLFSEEGNLIIDPYAGSGTTLVAARQLGRKAIGIDIDSETCDKAVEYISQQPFMMPETKVDVERLLL